MVSTKNLAPGGVFYCETEARKFRVTVRMVGPISDVSFTNKYQVIAKSYKEAEHMALVQACHDVDEPKWKFIVVEKESEIVA